MGRLERQLRDYLREGRYPFHMPGHKRRNVTGAALPYELDLTELPATDDLHAAEGILREAMARTAALYRVRRCWYLVNGSTCGNLAGIFAVTRQGGEILCARNCHRLPELKRYQRKLRGGDARVFPLHPGIFRAGDGYFRD